MNTMMTATYAVSCVASARPRPVGQILLADVAMTGQGTTLSIAHRVTSANLADAAVAGEISVVVPTGTTTALTFKTTDVARSHLGRPPV